MGSRVFILFLVMAASSLSFARPGYVTFDGSYKKKLQTCKNTFGESNPTKGIQHIKDGKNPEFDPVKTVALARRAVMQAFEYASVHQAINNTSIAVHNSKGAHLGLAGGSKIKLHLGGSRKSPKPMTEETLFGSAVHELCHIAGRSGGLQAGGFNSQPKCGLSGYAMRSRGEEFAEACSSRIIQPQLISIPSCGVGGSNEGVSQYLGKAMDQRMSNGEMKGICDLPPRPLKSIAGPQDNSFASAPAMDFSFLAEAMRQDEPGEENKEDEEEDESEEEEEEVSANDDQRCENVAFAIENADRCVCRTVPELDDITICRDRARITASTSSSYDDGTFVDSSPGSLKQSLFGYDPSKPESQHGPSLESFFGYDEPELTP